MVNETKEQFVLWQAALTAIGRALRHEFDCDQQQVPNHIRQVLAQFDEKERSKDGK